MEKQIDAQDLLDAIVKQRDAALNENARLKAYIAKLERQVGEAAKVVPIDQKQSG